MNDQKNVSASGWLAVSIGGFLLFLAAVIVLIVYAQKIDIKPQVYFILVVLLGLVCAAFLSGALKSHAKYSGKAYGGTIELGGPIVILIILVYLGHKYIPVTAANFNLRFNVFSAEEKKQLIPEGELTVLFNKPETQKIEKGFAGFTDVPENYKGKSLQVIAKAAGYQDFSQQINIPADGQPIILQMDKKADSVMVRGLVTDNNGEPLQHMLIVFGSGIAKDSSDELGNFNQLLPFKEGTDINIRVYNKSKLVYNSTQTLSEKTNLILQTK